MSAEEIELVLFCVQTMGGQKTTLEGLMVFLCHYLGSKAKILNSAEPILTLVTASCRCKIAKSTRQIWGQDHLLFVKFRWHLTKAGLFQTTWLLSLKCVEIESAQQRSEQYLRVSLAAMNNNIWPEVEVGNGVLQSTVKISHRFLRQHGVGRKVRKRQLKTKNIAKKFQIYEQGNNTLVPSSYMYEPDCDSQRHPW